MNREKELIMFNDYKKGFKISHKHSKNLVKNIESPHLKNIILSVYGSYQRDIKSNHLNLTNKMKFNRGWITLLNTMNNPKNNAKVLRSAVNLLHYMNCINIM